MKAFFFIISIITLLLGCTKNTSRGTVSAQSRDLKSKTTQSEQGSERSSKKIKESQNIQANRVQQKGTKVKMKKKGGVYHVPIKINEFDMEFIFDTGASDIVISSVEALFLYKQGKLSSEDILGTAKYQIADGSLSEGTVINLKTVQLGDKILHNVKASVVHNMKAPLLLGQSALSQFGKISIDYKESFIEFIE